MVWAELLCGCRAWAGRATTIITRDLPKLCSAFLPITNGRKHSQTLTQAEAAAL